MRSFSSTIGFHISEVLAPSRLFIISSFLSLSLSYHPSIFILLKPLSYLSYSIQSCIFKIEKFLFYLLSTSKCTCLFPHLLGDIPLFSFIRPYQIFCFSHSFNWKSFFQSIGRISFLLSMIPFVIEQYNNIRVETLKWAKQKLRSLWTFVTLLCMFTYLLVSNLCLPGLTIRRAPFSFRSDPFKSLFSDFYQKQT